ncbi:glycosyltransferase family 4 protein [Candidatus Peregrinibacteria bacterium]|nr:MAG: glycosyltransferase family 4 protein [Candidatus Peregrinibacteria bacterium]
MPSKLLLGIDASRSIHPKPTGVERYSTEIIRALLQEWKGEVRLYTPKTIAEFPEKKQKLLWAPRFWSVLRLSLEMLLHKPDLLFVPAHVLPFFAPVRSFVMIHDIAFEKIPKAYGSNARRYLRWSTRRAVRKAQTVLVPSEAVKADLMHFYKIDEARVTVIPHGPLSLDLPLKAGPRAKEPLFFYLGRLEAKKNLGVLLDAFAIVQKKYSMARLVLAGRSGFGWKEWEVKAQKQKGVDLPGFLDEKKVADLYARATAFVFPTLEEGFGFPLLQAFQAGCPVLCSDLAVLREVGGDAVLYADPKDTRAFAKAMLQLIDEPEHMAILSLKGKKRLEQFSWEKAAKSLVLLFNGSNALK